MKGKNLRRCLSVLLAIAFVFTMLPTSLLDTPVLATDADLTGSGTQDAPFQISSKDDLVKMRDHVNAKDKFTNGSEEAEYAGAYYILTADIDLEGAYGSSWYPIGRTQNGASSGTAFEGVFDGNGYTITGLYINGNDESHTGSYLYRFGLFGENKGTIKNLNVKDAALTDLQFWNGIIAATNNGTIENCSTSGVVNGTYLNGGIAGSCYTGTIKNCISTATGSASFGGICGGWSSSTATIENNYYPDTVTVAKGTYADGQAQAMSEEDFQSGKVAWLLQNAQADSSVLVWEQKIGEDSYPVLHRNGDSTENRVYKVSYMLDKAEVGEDYQNEGGTTKAPEIEADIEGFTAGDKWYKDEQLDQEWDFERDTVTADTTIYSEKKAIEYTITLNLNGGTISDNEWVGNVRTFTVQSEDITLPTPAKDGYRFIGWVSDGEDIVGAARETVTIEKGSMGDRIYTAVFKDVTAPDVTITIGEHTWQAFHEAPAFDLFYNTSQTVQLAATDNEAGELKIEYYISNKAMTEEQLGNVTWTPYTAPFTISPEKNYIIYAKVSDDDGNSSAMISTTGIVLEVTAPVIKGITEGSTSCEAAQFTVTDANLLSVTVDGEVIEAVNGKYTVSAVGSHTVAAADKAGNTSTVSFTISEHKQGLTIYETVVQAGCETEGTRIKKVYCSYCGTLYSTTVENVAVLGHNWGEWQTLDMPTCNDEGTEQRECRRCGKTETKGLEASGHDWEDDHTIDKEATCTEPGSKSIHCKKCPATMDSQVIPTVPHTPGDPTTDSFTDADCTEDGSYVLVTNCTVCGTEMTREPHIIPAKGHDFTEWEEVETPGCEDEGHLRRVCNICGLIETQDVAASGHKWDDDHTVDQAPTCTSVGSRSIHCSVCGATKDSEVIPSTGHTGSEPVKENVTDPSCTAPGSYDEVVYCTVCREELSRKTVSVAALGHDFSEWQTVDMPDCDDEGTQQRVCQVCGYTETRGLDASGHDWEDDYTVDSEPSCTSDGSKSIHCKKCDATKDSTVIPAVGHKFGEWVTIDMPDCDDEGTQQRVCEVCGYTETRGLDASGHDWEDDYTVDSEPSCTSDGSKSIHCKKCDATKDSEVIPSVGHNFGEWVTIDMPDCDDEGTQQRVCQVCGYTETRGLDASGHDWEDDYTVDSEPSCTSDGSKSIHCKKCDATKDSEVIPAVGHKFGEWVTIDMPDCDDEGTQQRVCEVCGYTETRGLDASGHDWEEDYTVDSEPSCTSDGSKSIHCKKCDAVKDSEVIPSVGYHVPVIVGAKEATSYEDGYTGDVICDVCGELLEKGEVIPATGGNTDDNNKPDDSNTGDNVSKPDDGNTGNNASKPDDSNTGDDVSKPDDSNTGDDVSKPDNGNTGDDVSKPDNSNTDDNSKPNNGDASDESPKTGSALPHKAAIMVCIMAAYAVISNKEKTRKNK